MLRRPVAKSKPIAGCTCTWFTPASWYSIGSSSVMIFTSGRFRRERNVYSVVVLPEPVGPVSSTTPEVTARSSSTRVSTSADRPSSFMS